MVVIETLRLRLQPLEPRHASGPYLSWMNDEEITRYLESRFRKYSEDDLAAFIDQANSDPDVVLCGMFRRADGQHIGNIKLGPINHHHRRSDMGLIVGNKSCWGQGYGREAILAVTFHAFSALRLHKLTAGCYAANVGSVRAFLAAGFVQEGVRHSHYRCGATWHDGLLFGRVNPDE